jgi:ubiquinone/menaquinone biosynthesis methyltransferase
MPSRLPDADEIRGLFNRIAPVYDDLNQSLSLGLHRIWKKMAVQWSGAQSGMVCLDVCCGSGDLALLLARQVGKQGRVVGVDFAEAQLAIARCRARQQGWETTTDWIEADALALPFETAHFEAATMGYGLRNLTDIPGGLKELSRVLQPGARAAILDFHRATNPQVQQFQQWYLETVVIPAADRRGLTAEYAYIGPSVDRFPTGPEQIQLARQSGFTDAIHYPLAGGVMGVLVATR